MRLELILPVIRKEMRETLRDRRSLFVMFGIPLVLYPVLALAMGKLVIWRQHEIVQQSYRVAVINEKADPILVGKFEMKDSGFSVLNIPDPQAALARREIDLILGLPTDLATRAHKAEPVKVRVWLDRSRTEAPVIERKLRKIISDYSNGVIEARLSEYKVPKAVLQPIETETEDIATNEQRMGKVLAMTLPMILLMTGMLGAFFPALNATTTEREAGTLEALLVTPVSKMELLLAKGIVVFFSSVLSAGLNLLSMSLVFLRVMSLAGQKGLNVSMGSLMLAFVAALPALIFFSAMVMVVGLLARSFREANAYARPVMLLPVLSMIVSIGEMKADTAMLLTPIINTAVVIRDVLADHGSAREFILAFASSCAYAGLMLSAATRMFTSEQLVNPTWEPLSFKGLRLGGGQRRLPAIDEALALFAVVLLLLFYVSPSLSNRGLLPAVAGNELLLITAPTLLLAAVAGYRWRETFSFNKAPALSYAGAALLAAGMSLFIGLPQTLLDHVWPGDGSTAAQQLDLIWPALSRHPILTVLMVGSMAGICEELMFRGPVQAALRRQFSIWPTLLISGLLFAALHLDLHGLPARLFISLFLGWLVWRSGSIFPAMLMHGLYDAMQLADMYLQCRGMTVAEMVAQAAKENPLGSAELYVRAGIGLVLLILGLYACGRSFGPVAKTVREPVEAVAV